MSVFIEDGEDLIQKRLVEEIQSVREAMGPAASGILGSVRLKGLEKKLEKLSREYNRRGYQLGVESNGWRRG